MIWVWLWLAFVGGTVFGLAYGRRARMTAFVVGYRSGLQDGWNDAETLAAGEDYVPPPVPRDTEIGEGYKAFLAHRFGTDNPSAIEYPTSNVRKGVD